MSTISLRSIKYESIKAIFASVADAEKISRADISGKTDLSLVTIGKIADALLELDILCQAKEVKQQAGRRAGMLSVNDKKFAIILDLTSYEFRYALFNLRLNLIERSSYEYKQNLTFEENLNIFLAETRSLSDKKYGLSNCFGVGVAVPGPYNPENGTVLTARVPELGNFCLEDTVKRYFPSLPLRIDSQVNAAAKSNITNVENYAMKNIVYWYIGNAYVCGAYLVKGNLILGKDEHACRFGMLRVEDGLTLEEKLAKCDNLESYAYYISLAVGDIINILSPHTLIIEYDSKFVCEDIIPLIRKDLTEVYGMDDSDIPDMMRACCKFRNSHRGLTMDLRDMWLDRMVFGEDKSEL